jgi:hypothetical protein
VRRSAGRENRIACDGALHTKRYRPPPEGGASYDSGIQMRAVNGSFASFTPVEQQSEYTNSRRSVPSPTGRRADALAVAGRALQINKEVNAMENLIAAAALSILGIGLIASIMGLIEFTRCFDNSPEPPTPGAVAAQPYPSTGTQS